MICEIWKPREFWVRGWAINLKENQIGSEKLHFDDVCVVEKSLVDKLLDKVEKFIRASHHTDGCAHRYRNECDCNKFELLNSIKEFRSNE